MLELSVLKVGDGLCVVGNCHYRLFVFDCGGSRSWQRLRDHAAPRGRIATIAVSHLHQDHYAGLMKPLSSLRSDLNLILGRLPTINRDAALTQAFTMRLMTISSPRSGPRDFDLIDSLRQSVPNLKTRWVHRDCTFRTACQTWTVKWPPPEIFLGQTHLGALQGAINAYDAAADEIPWLKNRLSRIRDNQVFASWEADSQTLESDSRDLGEFFLDADVEEAEVDNAAGDNADVDDEAQHNAETSNNDEARADYLTPRQRGLLSEASKKMGRAANDMSLVLVSDNDVLLTGDATKQVTELALGSASHSFSVVVTPHHGGKTYVPDAVTNGSLTSRYWATSVGTRLSDHVASIYDNRTGPHYRTDRCCCKTSTCNLSFVMNHPGVHSNAIAVPYYSSCSPLLHQ